MSQIALKFSALTRYAGRHGNAMALAAVLGLSAAMVAPVHADGTKIGFVSRSEEHTSELQSLMRISYAVFCLQKKSITLLLHRYVALDYHTVHTRHTMPS